VPPLIRRTDPVLREFVSQRAARKSHASRRFSLRTVRRGQGTHDQLPLRMFENPCEVERIGKWNRKSRHVRAAISVRRGIFLAKGKVVGADLLIAAQNVGPLDQVL
jgi:hypothetical protein